MASRAAQLWGHRPILLGCVGALAKDSLTEDRRHGFTAARTGFTAARTGFTAACTGFTAARTGFTAARTGFTAACTG
ncbi:hypothetical protein KKB55_20280, partial [Myxococcota bacterium]|nr:hypothetical protein [Myxococcota bacterium]